MIVRIKLSIDILHLKFATLYIHFGISFFKILQILFLCISFFAPIDFGGIFKSFSLISLSFFFFYNFCYNKPIVPTFRENSSGIDSILTQLFVSRRDKIFTDTRKEMVILNSDLLFKYYNPRFKYDLLHIIP